MKSLLVIASLLLPFSAFCQEDSEKRLIIWPRYDWTDTEFENLAKSRLHNGDGLIMSYFAGMKDGFRSNRYAIEKRKVLLQFPGLPEASQMEDFLLKKQNGIGGHFFEISNPSLNIDLNQTSLEEVIAKGERLRAYQIFAIDYPTARKTANLKLLASKVNAIALYPERTLTAKRKTVVSFIEKTASKLHELNSELEIWLAFNMRAENNDLEEITSLLDNTPASISGYIITFRHSPENVRSASELLKRLRPSNDDS
ncbi:hypothetical protein [Pelagicoccus mobilis]|uniref:Uncharacterized protein n=1 Tax=Pelagicoccus mobilis TaxID=415221 RepID=A0A934RUU2_9BACT|nr:hypothetical protein [Pelagicoccus mobilis]MBK1876851.1 hypothetical protein [Pelagicoccus mobilis]